MVCSSGDCQKAKKYLQSLLNFSELKLHMTVHVLSCKDHTEFLNWKIIIFLFIGHFLEQNKVSVDAFFFWPEQLPPPPPKENPKISQKQKISLEKLPWICTTPPPHPTPRHTYPRFFKKQRSPHSSHSSLSKKIHAKNLKIFIKKFIEKNLFWGYEKRGFLGENSQEKIFRSKKKRLSFVLCIKKILEILPN